MKFTSDDIVILKSILEACKVLEIDGIVITEGMVRGAKPSLDAAIISKCPMSISEALKIGIGRVKELDKRLAVFTLNCSIEGKSNDSGDVSLLTIQEGKTKMQFRCTSANLMKYPKSNDDVPVATVTFNKVEANQISKAVKTLGSETVVLHISRTGVAKIECVDSSNDKFEIELSSQVKYADEENSLVQTYLAGMFIDVIDTMARDSEAISFVVGEVGSITAVLKGHTCMIMPQITGDE